MITYLFLLLFTLGCGLLLIGSGILLANDRLLRKHLQWNSKADLLISRYGLQKTVELSRQILLPVAGCLFLTGTVVGFRGLLVLNTLL